MAKIKEETVNLVKPKDLLDKLKLFSDKLMQKAFEESSDPEEIRLKILADIIGAKSVEELDGRTYSLQDFPDVPLKVLSANFYESSYKGGIPLFAALEVIPDDGTGEVITVVSGATDLVIKIGKAWIENWLPVMLVAKIATKPTQNGFYPFNISVYPVAAG